MHQRLNRPVIWAVALLVLAAVPAHGEEAMDYFNRGLKSSLATRQITYFSKALELDPKLAAAYEKRGMIYYYQGKYDKVIQDFQAYVELAPEQISGYRLLGLGYLNKGLYEPAVVNFTRAIKLDPQYGAAYAGRAEAYVRSGRLAEAMSDATRAISLKGNPQSEADAYRTRAKVYREMGRMDLAVADLRAAWGVDPRWSVWSRYFFRYASPEELRGAGLVGIIVIVFVLIFGLTLKPPEKRD
jgi:tetratricopeptide (TPR) repeat protein